MNQYTAKAIANAFLDIAESEGAKIAPMKMQKLAYIAHGWGLGFLGESLINEDVEAWTYGPVISNLYHEFKQYGSNFITRKATNVSLDPKSLKIVEEVPNISPDDQDANALLLKVWEIYGKFTGPQLSNITHLTGTPWDTTYNGSHQRIIPRNIIEKHYKSLIEKRAN